MPPDATDGRRRGKGSEAHRAHNESWVAYAERIGCSHAWYLSWANTGCEGCRHTSLSPSLKRLEDTFDGEG
jgi:hypothetical protein